MVLIMRQASNYSGCFAQLEMLLRAYARCISCATFFNLWVNVLPHCGKKYRQFKQSAVEAHAESLDWEHFIRLEPMSAFYIGFSALLLQKCVLLSAVGECGYPEVKEINTGNASRVNAQEHFLLSKAP